jgi:hypothetical protein
MPRLGHYQSLLKSVVFLYETVEDAVAGKKSGGTGFLVGVPSEAQGRNYAYCVTNWHVACQGAPIIRINKRAGSPEILDVPIDHWHFLPGGPDLAVTAVRIEPEEHDAILFQLSREEEDLSKTQFGPFDVGDDVFMIGRFIDYEGAETNRPALRFGNISIMNANIRQKTGYRGPSIVVDMHSRTGFSGSPVFAYRTSGSHFGKGGVAGAIKGDEEIFVGHTMQLLGVHFGQFPEVWKIGDVPISREEETSLLTDGKYVEGLSGMTTVILANDLRALLYQEKFVTARKEADELLKQSLAAKTELRGPPS